MDRNESLPQEESSPRKLRLQFSLASMMTAFTALTVFLGLLQWDLRITFRAVMLVGAVCGALGARRLLRWNIAMVAGGAIGGYCITALMALMHHLCEVLFFEGQRTFYGVADCLQLGMYWLQDGALIGAACWAIAIVIRWRRRRS